MAANKFATMVHNNTNKITLILIYAVLEWMLIVLLLLNSVFSYLIIKFAEYFGLKPPCFCCSRIDRLRYNLCELHSKEVSGLKFCSKHKKLGEFGVMCLDCSSSDLGFRRESRNFVFSKVERIDVVEDEVKLKCSCCGVNFEKKIVDNSSCFVIDPLWYIGKQGNPINEQNQKIELNYVEENKVISEDEEEEIEAGELEIEVIRDSNLIEHDLIQFEKGEDLHSQDLQFFIDYCGNQLFPFELIDPKTEEQRNDIDDEDHEFGDFQKAQMNSQEVVDSTHQKTEEASKFAEKTLVSHENLIDFGDEEVAIDEETQTPLIDNNKLQQCDSNIHPAHEELQEEEEEEKEEEEEEEEVSIGTEIPVLDSCDEIKHEEPSADYNELHSNPENDFEVTQGEENAGELKNLSVNVEEIEEDKAPETPSSIYSPNPLHKKWLFPETREQGVEESFDGSVISETDCDDPMSTAEKLKAALKAERKALHALYLELEEERNASAVAANETMAMINRLQEEKAAMQTEALQYQRMMEEQSEYDQEALELLNELMMKKEKELDLYRKKLSDYEAREKVRVLQRGTKTGTSSVSWSHSEDEEGSSVDLYQVPKDDNALDGSREIQHLSTPPNSFFDLESSLADFEEERLSILEQLKFLEEKLLALSDEEDRHFANVKIMQDHYEEINHIGFNGQVTECAINGLSKHEKQPTGKRLLPLFEETVNGGEDDVTVRNGYENGFHSTYYEDTAVTRFELEKKRIDMEEEVDQLYTRLQALEADREFLKHCIGSVKKGDKGMELLQEILHHLRDLRDVNLRAKNYTHNALL